jgi:hypothetical protein
MVSMTKTHRKKPSLSTCTHRTWIYVDLPPDHGTPDGETVRENVPTLEDVKGKEGKVYRCTQCKELVYSYM